ncbi:MAG: histidine--tRNA ligase [Thiotrichales bacterium]|nr:MAG: histidine--tRNA ligase [Thiotrichales bacterium]
MNKKISGFPEWLPQQKRFENSIIELIQEQFESFGFTPIETRAVESLADLLAKGETSQEVYTLHRLQEELQDTKSTPDRDKQLGLHFDLTVPFARYVLQNQSKLTFPFKRYQIQKVWRGERPQAGRFREFYQADFDVVAHGELPLHFDIEMPLLLSQLLAKLPIPKVVTHINNRKVLQGFYMGLGIQELDVVLRIMDKLHKIGSEKVLELLTTELKVSDEIAEKCLRLANIKTSDAAFVEIVKAMNVQSEMLERGLNELSQTINSLNEYYKDQNDCPFVVDLSIARGLNYYTGSIYESYFVDHPKLGAICSGGRYDNLLSGMGKTKLPGIGLSIGLTRIMSHLFSNDLATKFSETPSLVLITLPNDEHMIKAQSVAAKLRSRNIACEVFHKPAKYGKQIAYADKKQIPYVLFFGEDDKSQYEIRNIVSGEQTAIDLASWKPALS